MTGDKEDDASVLSAHIVLAVTAIRHADRVYLPLEWMLHNRFYAVSRCNVRISL